MDLPLSPSANSRKLQTTLLCSLYFSSSCPAVDPEMCVLINYFQTHYMINFFLHLGLENLNYHIKLLFW